MARAAVIGAGPAGLAAAWTLASGGVQVDVYEQRERAGGVLRTEELDGARVDVGVQLVASAHDALFTLARETGAAALLKAAPGRDALWRRGRAHGITYGSVASMIASGALPTTLKLKLGARYLPYLKTAARSLDASDLAGSGGAAFDTESIAAWGRRELGDDFVELLVYPLLAAYYGAVPEETSAGVYHALARVGMDVRVYGAAGGFGALADALVAALQAKGAGVYTARAVTSVHASGDGVVIGLQDRDETYDGAVIAVPANRAARLLDPTGPLAAWLGAVQERSTFTVAFRLDRAFPGDYFGLSFPRITDHGRSIAALCIQRRKLTDLVPAGDAVVVMPAPAAVQRLAARSDDELGRALLADVEAVVPGITRRVTATRVTRFDDAYTLFEPGHVRRLQQLDPEWLPARVALAGDYLTAPSVEGAVRSGRRAAQRLLSS